MTRPARPSRDGGRRVDRPIDESEDAGPPAELEKGTRHEQEQPRRARDRKTDVDQQDDARALPLLSSMRDHERNAAVLHVVAKGLAKPRPPAASGGLTARRAQFQRRDQARNFARDRAFLVGRKTLGEIFPHGIFGIVDGGAQLHASQPPFAPLAIAAIS